MELVWKTGAVDCASNAAKYQVGTGTVSTGAVATTPIKALVVIFQAPTSHGIVVGGPTAADCVWASGTRKGLLVSDGSGTGTVIHQKATIEAGGADAQGTKGVRGQPWIDLNKLYVQGETNGDDLFWLALCIE